MIKKTVDIAVIGGGPAGLAAAVSSKENGADSVIILDRNTWIGGILPQCIHDGFGVEETGESMTGPEYAQIYIDKAKKNEIIFSNETMVLEIKKNLEIIAINKKGILKIKANSVILAMGCREKTRWNYLIPGSRPSGIYTAGVAQAFINLYNIIPGENVLVLGSGDVGLIIARRLKLEGANVLGVVEILPYTSGLSRNVVQCLDDYGIPLFLNHTITNISGKNRLESVNIAQVDKDFKIINKSERKIKCDTLLLSLGLIPENELSKKIGIEIDDITGGPIINQNFETSIPGIYACGNCLQVYDTVDVLSKGALYAGKKATEKRRLEEKIKLFVKPGKSIRYVIPQRIDKAGLVNFTLRVLKPDENVYLVVKLNHKEIFRKKLRWINPANMLEFDLEIKKEIIKPSNFLEVSING